MRKELELDKDSIIKLLIKYSVPSIIAMTVTSLYNIIDRIFIGYIPNVGALAIAGLGITMPIFTIIVAFGVLISMGTSTNISIKLGQQKEKEAEIYLMTGVIISSITALITMFLGLVFIDEILIIFGASNNTINYAKEYISIIFLATPFNIIGFTLNNSIRSDGNPNMAAKTMILGCILNFVLDPIFIFLFNMGIKGAAIATALSQLIISVWIFYYFTKGKSNLKLRVTNLKINLNIIKDILTLGLPPFFMEIAASLVLVLMNNSLKLYGGDLAIAAMTAVTSVALIFIMPVFGINQGAQVIIGYNYGAKKYQRVKKTVILSITMASILLICGFLLIQFTPKTFISIFSKEKELINIGIGGLRIYLSTLPILGIAIIGPTYFQAIGKASYSMFLSLLRQCILLIPLLIILSNKFSLIGVWIAQPVADIISAIIIVVFLAKNFKSN